MVSADTGFCSVHLCPQSKSKVPHVYAANSSTCSQNTPVPEEGFLGGKLTVRAEALMQLRSLLTTDLFAGKKATKPTEVHL